MPFVSIPFSDRFPIHHLHPDSHPQALSHWFEGPMPPRELYVQCASGQLEKLGMGAPYTLGVVGTRQPSLRSLTLIQASLVELKRFQSRPPWLILSGLAEGVDRSAHESALEAGLWTAAVMGTGLASTYPSSHHELRGRILESGGWIISELPHAEGGSARTFLWRNRLIALGARATWVVEAPSRSGAINTGNWAARFDRQLYVTPCFPSDTAMRGNVRLLQQVAGSIPFWDVGSLAETWATLLGYGRERGRRRSVGICTPELSIAAQGLFERMVSLHKEGLSTRTANLQQEWEPEVFFSALHELVTKNVIEETSGSWGIRS